jgi:ankyrin repeat protein
MPSALCLFGVKQRKPLSNLIGRRKWNSVQKRLQSKEAEPKDGDTDMMNVGNSQETILHVICRKNPPLSIIELILQIYPTTVSKLNRNQQYPLHVAAQCGASPEIIKCLSESFPDAVDHADEEGKTPLHLTCESYASTYRAAKSPDGALVSMQDAMIKTVDLLNKPSVVNLEDEEGMTALEYAIDTNADLRIVKNIQRACERSWRSIRR